MTRGPPWVHAGNELRKLFRHRRGVGRGAWAVGGCCGYFSSPYPQSRRCGCARIGQPPAKGAPCTVGRQPRGSSKARISRAPGSKQPAAERQRRVRSRRPRCQDLFMAVPPSESCVGRRCAAGDPSPAQGDVECRRAGGRSARSRSGVHICRMADVLLAPPTDDGRYDYERRPVRLRCDARTGGDAG